MKVVVWISRILLGVVFIFSGFVKAIDPLGSTYKFQDYFTAFGMEWLSPLALVFSIALSSIEFIIGFAILLGLNTRISSWGGLLFMVFFTPLTLYIALGDPVQDCGCFGDALIISNWETFYKNIFILAAALVVFLYRMKIPPLISKKADNLLIVVFSVLILGVSVYSLRNLPLIDFRPWKKGNNVAEMLRPAPEVAEIFLLFENQETGEVKEYPVSDYPWDDPEWNAVWKYKDQRREIIQPAKDAPISNFFVQDYMGYDITDALIAHPGYQLIVVAYDLGKTNSRAFVRRINPLAAQAASLGIPLVVLTASSWEDIEAFRHENQTPYPFYQSGEIALKTIIRSNPGLLLMESGVVVDKWAHRNIPSADQLVK